MINKILKILLNKVWEKALKYQNMFVLSDSNTLLVKISNILHAKNSSIKIKNPRGSTNRRIKCYRIK